jgi:hypothetical protein
MFSALLLSQLAFANDVLILPFQVEGMTNIHWTPHLERGLMDQLSLHRIAHVSPNQLTQEYGLKSFCVDTDCIQEMLFRPESELVLYGMLDCQKECSLYLSVYDGFSEKPKYQMQSKGTYADITRQIPMLVAKVSQYINNKYDLESTDTSLIHTSRSQHVEIASSTKIK